MKKRILTIMGLALIAALTAFQVSAQDDDMDKPGGGKSQRKEMKKHQQRKGGRMNMDGQDDRMDKFMQFMASLSDEERAKLEKLKKEDPEAFKAEMQKLREKAKEQRKQDEAKMRDLVKKYREAKTDEEKQQALAAIKTEVEKVFNATMAGNKKFIEQAEKSLADLKKTYEEKLKNASLTIDEKVNNLTKEKDQPKKKDDQD